MTVRVEDGRRGSDERATSHPTRGTTPRRRPAEPASLAPAADSTGVGSGRDAHAHRGGRRRGDGGGGGPRRCAFLGATRSVPAAAPVPAAAARPLLPSALAAASAALAVASPFVSVSSGPHARTPPRGRDARRRLALHFFFSAALHESMTMCDAALNPNAPVTKTADPPTPSHPIPPRPLVPAVAK